PMPNPSAKIRSANIGSRKVASTTRVARPEITGNSISSLSERSTEALALTRSQLRENLSNMVWPPWNVRDRARAPRRRQSTDLVLLDRGRAADVTVERTAPPARVPGPWPGRLRRRHRSACHVDRRQASGAVDGGSGWACLRGDEGVRP